MKILNSVKNCKMQKVKDHLLIENAYFFVDKRSLMIAHLSRTINPAISET